MAHEYEKFILSLLTSLAIKKENKGYYVIADEVEDVYAKAKAFDELKKHVDEQGDSYMDLYRQTKDPIFSLLNNNYDGLLGFIEELEDEVDD